MKPIKTKTVFKYPITNRDVQQIDLPEGAEVLHVNLQNGLPYIWVLHDATLLGDQVVAGRPDMKDAVTERRTFRLAGTGHPIDGTIKKYIGTFMMHGGALVFHFFELDR